MKLSDIKDPDTLTATVEHEGITLEVRSIDCSAYNDYIRATWLKNSMRKDTPNDAELAEVDRMGAAKLVSAWNLDDECTADNVSELFRKMRSVVAQVYIAANRLGKPDKPELPNSGNGASEDSGSGKQSKAEKSPAKNTGSKSEKLTKS